MISITDEITSFLYKINKIEEWRKNTALTEILFSHLPYFTEQIEMNHTKPPLVIFDIDDTLMDTGRFSKKHFPLLDGFEPTITLYNYLQDLGYHLVILTARNENRRDVTEENLKRINIKNYDELIMRNDSSEPFGAYKLKQRKNLSKNYTIVANIGDQISDFEGGYNGKIIKVPTF
jgi:predicted secreted acid phosphatase